MVITPVPEVKVKAILSPVNGAAKVNDLLAVLEPPDVLIVVAAVKPMDVLDAPIVVGPLLVHAPAKEIELGAVAVKPAPKVNVSDDRLPSLRLPVLLKVVALVIAVVAPTNDRLYEPEPELNVVIVVPPLKETSPACELLIVKAVTAPLVPAA